ncbi:MULTISPECIES: M14 family zinc carboxypeptidase [unclassified Anaeromyxobacter]|uniref:M14 family zinc carboxypeptidase n=1 Tax=unclassified Anaeromyxobacter TaxID=2620896 RepID=UPI001F588D61|nr:MULTISPECIES: M14 family zinc carboxypeptidase [unclassified Anaeromyxobacter]
MPIAPAAALAAALLSATAQDLVTTAERTAFERTGRYDEAVRLCRDYARAFPRRARCVSFGVTPERRELVALVASADGVLTPYAARARRRPVVLFQGAIHAGELDGKDAGFILLRELLRKGGGPLAGVTAVFVPVFNVDGHERFGPLQRPNQRGPLEAGWRVTAANLNLNRDYLKADAPETRAMLALLRKWDPIVYADLHVTDGAQFQHDLAVMVEPRFGYAAALRPEGAALSEALLARLTTGGHLPVDFYPSFREDGDPASGFAQGVPPPHFGHGYWAAQDRIGILLEAHSWRPYGERVKGAVDFLRALLELAAERGARWRAAAERADREAPALAGREVALAFEPTGEPTPLAFRGYAYVREPSVVTGAPVTRYDESRPEVWNVPYLAALRPAASAVLPRGGWVVPAGFAEPVAAKLAVHGVRFERLGGARPPREVEVFRATEAKFRAEPFEGRQQLSVKGAWACERRSIGAGALFVPVAQPRALVAAHLLEPAAPDALLAWGTFNAAFERKEYIEDYVLEPFARQLLAEDAAVRAEWEQRLADPTFAADRRARSEFFFRRHPAWDETYRRYPVVRVDARP